MAAVAVAVVAAVVWFVRRPRAASPTAAQQQQQQRPIPVVTPSPTVMGAFEERARPLYERIVATERDSRTLAAVRDALLPKLISGELHLRDAERFIGKDV